MFENISKLYISSFSSITSAWVEPSHDKPVFRVLPFTQFDFCGAIGISFLFIIQKVALSAFYLGGSVATGFLHEKTRNHFFQNLQDIPLYVGAVVIGNIGLLFPQMVNEKVLGIPAKGLTMDRFPVLA